MRYLSVASILFLGFCLLYNSTIRFEGGKSISIGSRATAMDSDTTTQKIQLTNPPNNESGDAPAPGGDQPAKESAKGRLITTTITGAGEEFDGKRYIDRPLKWWEKKLARKMRKIALGNHGKFVPLEEADTVGPHLIVAIIRGTGEFDGVYYRDEPLEDWELQVARTLLALAKEGGAENEPDEKK